MYNKIQVLISPKNLNSKFKNKKIKKKKNNIYILIKKNM